MLLTYDVVLVKLTIRRLKFYSAVEGFWWAYGNTLKLVNSRALHNKLEIFMKHQLKVVTLTMFFLALGGYEAAIAQDTATVVATGYGQSVDLALKNASKNAMMQVVGTMIDSSSTVESQLQIRGAAEEYAKSIESRTAEYSQGSIEQVELLSTNQDGPLTIVTAKVTVRKEELQAYIKRSTEAKASVSQELFSNRANPVKHAS